MSPFDKPIGPTIAELQATGQLPATPDVTDWFRAAAYHPALPGLYEVRNGWALRRRDPHRLIGRFRYWDGTRWLTDCHRFASSFGEHTTHEWRGRRMWVIATDKCNLRPGVRTYLLKISRRKAIHLDDRPMHAQAFTTQAEADAYIGKHPRHALEYDLQAVLA